MTRKVEFIIRLPNLHPDYADQLEEQLRQIARITIGSRISRIERDHYEDGSSLHVSRRKVVV